MCVVQHVCVCVCVCTPLGVSVWPGVRSVGFTEFFVVVLFPFFFCFGPVVLLLQVHHPAKSCERTELPSYQRKVLPEAEESLGRSLTDTCVCLCVGACVLCNVVLFLGLFWFGGTSGVGMTWVRVDTSGVQVPGSGSRDNGKVRHRDSRRVRLFWYIAVWWWWWCVRASKSHTVTHSHPKLHPLVRSQLHHRWRWRCLVFLWWRQHHRCHGRSDGHVLCIQGQLFRHQVAAGTFRCTACVVVYPALLTVCHAPPSQPLSPDLSHHSTSPTTHLSRSTSLN